MTGTVYTSLHTNQSQSYLNHLVYWRRKQRSVWKKRRHSKRLYYEVTKFCHILLNHSLRLDTNPKIYQLSSIHSVVLEIMKDIWSQKVHHDLTDITNAVDTSARGLYFQWPCDSRHMRGRGTTWWPLGSPTRYTPLVGPKSVRRHTAW